jgi:hypothetical protein
MQHSPTWFGRTLPIVAILQSQVAGGKPTSALHVSRHCMCDQITCVTQVNHMIRAATRTLEV